MEPDGKFLMADEEDGLGEAVAAFLIHVGSCPLSMANAYLYQDLDSDDNPEVFPDGA
jgi:hypothetical protein